ncbi:hypothetical protein IF2G_10868 [Cordyceps javanica]|nr:hypothetical protein IF2G_10868 [Cordyceps javanica]
MATQCNLDYQTFWAPRPSSRPRGVDGQSHIRPLPQPKSSPLPPNYSRGMIGVSKGSPDASPRLASSRDDVVYISDDAASDANDMSHERFDESLPSIQAIVQSLEDPEKMGNTDDGFEQPLQRKDAHDACGRSTDSAPPEQELPNESPTPTVGMAAECPIDVSASTSRMCTSAPASMADGSRIGIASCESSLRDADSPYARSASVSAEHEGATKPSSEIPQHVDSQLYPPSSASQSQRPPSPPHDDCDGGGRTPRGSPGPSQTMVSSKDDSFDVFDTAFDHHASCDISADETLSSVRTAVRPQDETRKIRSTVDDSEQISDPGDAQEPSSRPHSSPLLDRGHTHHGAGFSVAEAADCPTEVASSTSRIRSSTASSPASSQLNSLSPESQVWDTVSTQTSCTSMSAPGNGEDEIDDQICTGTEPPENATNGSSEQGYESDKETLMSPTSPRTQKKRSWESLVIHGLEQSEAEGLGEVVDDPEYYPSTSDESEDDGNSPPGGEEQASPKRRKVRAEPSKLQPRTQEDAPVVAEPTDAAFDEWILQDVVLKRTIMDDSSQALQTA